MLTQEERRQIFESFSIHKSNLRIYLEMGVETPQIYFVH